MFRVLISIVGPSLERKNTNMRKNILVETIVAMALTRFGWWKFITNVWRGLWHCKKYSIHYSENFV
jgi:hypothetical protein